MFFQKKNDKCPHYFFNQGWGESLALEKLSKYSFQNDSAKKLKLDLRPGKEKYKHSYFEGSFVSPFPHEYLPAEAKEVHFQIHSPAEEFEKFPICILFSMTGDEGYSYRFNSYSKYLLKKGIATLLLENPFYGLRRPSYQKDFHFVSVSDMLAMALSAVEEGIALLHWLKERGCSKLGVAGVSQAAMMAGAVGALTPFPVAVGCSLVAHSPEVILCDGLLRKFVNWKALNMENFAETQYRLIQLFAPTDLTKLPRPCFPKATILQGAFNDLVAPRYSVKMIHRLWPGSELRWLPGTHLTSLALHKNSFSKIICDSFANLETTSC
jgi:hypothetical protein